MIPIIPQELKRCTKCNNEYPRTQKHWHRANKNPDGLQYWCKTCLLAYNRIWHKNNPESRKATMRKWADNNLDVKHAIERRWRKDNPDKKRSKDQRRHARKLSLPHTLTQAEWENILADYGYQCAYCDKTWLDCKLTQDHVIPLSQGGGYTADNIVPACLSCNDKKGARTPEQAGMSIRAKF